MESVLVLLSTYNGEKYIKQQYDSLINQENIDVHILIRDDGSTDSTLEEIGKLNSKALLPVIKGKNIGACKSFFALIGMASLDYEYYAFCDQDDVWKSNKLIRAITELSKVDSRKPSLYFCGQTITDADLKVLYEHRMDCKRSVYANCIFNQMAGCTAVFNRKLMIQLKKEIPMNIFGHDVWTYRLCAALDGEILVDEDTFLYYRQHSSNVVGLRNSLYGRIRRAKQYIYKYKPSEYAREILRLYSSDLSLEKKKFFKAIESSNVSRQSRKELIHNYDIHFNNLFLGILFRLKVLMRQM